MKLNKYWDRLQDMYEVLDELIEAIRECQDNIEYATEAIIDYTDY